jgi:hypothetical protein
MFVYYNYTLYIYISKQTNDNSPTKKQQNDNFKIRKQRIYRRVYSILQ